MKRLRLLAALLLAALACASCTSTPNPGASPSAASSSGAAFQGYNVIIISMNNVGAEHMSLYGYKRPTTPKLDEMAKSAIVFERAYTPTSWTLPAATSLFSSVQPYSHRVMDRWESNLLNLQVPVLGELFKAKGYATATFTGGLDYRPTFGHLRGLTDASFNLDFTQFDTSFAQATRWLGYNSDKPFFLVVQGYDAHPPFRPQPPYKGLFSHTVSGKVNVSSNFALRGFKNGDKYIASYIWEESDPRRRAMLDIAYPPEKRTLVLTQTDMDYLRDLYDDTIAGVDGRVAEFLSKIDPKVMARTIVVLESEHGEMFGKHGRFGRAGTVRGTLYEDVVHVPLIIKLPTGKAARLGGLVQLVDVAPTLLEYVGIAAPSTFQGKSLVPMIETGKPVNDYVFAGSYFNMGSKKGRKNPFFSDSSVNESIRSDRWKLIHEVLYPPRSPEQTDVKPTSDTYELYDLKADPDEQHDVSKENPEVVADLKKRLEAWNQETSQALADKKPTDMAFPPDFEEKARRHGYW